MKLSVLIHRQTKLEPSEGTLKAWMSQSQEFDAAVKLHEYAAPVIPMAPHPFFVVDGNAFCGTCGGGILHPIHQTQPQLTESRV